MKKTLAILILTGLFLCSWNSFSQSTLKLGHINSQLVLSAMPEMDSAQKQLQREVASIEKTVDELRVEFNKKYEDYTKLANDPNTSALILRTKEEELQSIQQRSQTFQEQAEQTISQKRADLFQPIQNKAIKAVNDVAAENGFSYIFDTASGALVYTSPDSQDILPLVKTKLGLK
jgi:outer membrane protein